MANPEAALEQEIEQARQRGAEAAKREPRAVKAWYDLASDRLCIDLTNGVGILLPRKLLQGLSEATPEEMAAVEVSPSGYGLSWEALDVDLGVPQLVAGVFGTRSWMTEIGLNSPFEQSA